MTETQPQNRRLGYARVSTYGQTHDSHLEQLPEVYGAAVDDIERILRKAWRRSALGRGVALAASEGR